MRFPAILFAFTLLASPAKADPASDTLALYQITAERAPFLMEILEDIGDPVATADRIKVVVDAPVEAAIQEWMDAAFNSGGSSEPFRPFAACYEAGSALMDFTAKVQRYLRGIDKTPFTTGDAEPFREKLGACETALDLPVTFR